MNQIFHMLPHKLLCVHKLNSINFYLDRMYLMSILDCIRFMYRKIEHEINYGSKNYRFPTDDNEDFPHQTVIILLILP